MIKEEGIQPFSPERISRFGLIVKSANGHLLFSGLADFQYLAMKKKEDGSGFESFYDRIVPRKLQDWTLK